MARFYSEYIGPNNTTTPFIDFLPKFYDRPRLDPSFHHAVPAVALASASRQLRAPGLMIEAQRRYSQTLTSLAAAIADERKAKSDEVFTAVFLMVMFEVISTEHHTEGVWDSHSPGHMALSLIRGPEQLKSHVGRAMYTVGQDAMVSVLQLLRDRILIWEDGP